MNGSTQTMKAAPKGSAGFLDRVLKLKENANVRTELIAAIFMAAACIIVFSPSILSTTGMGKDALAAETCTAAIIMSLYTKLQFPLVSGMELNGFFMYFVCDALKGPRQEALTAVLIEGIILIILSLAKVRELVIYIYWRLYSYLKLFYCNYIDFVRYGLFMPDKKIIIVLIGR